MSDIVPSAQPRFEQREIDRFFFNKSLQQQGLEWRLGEMTRDVRTDIRRVGAAVVQQQERAAAAYAAATTKQLGAMQEQETANAAKLRDAVSASAELLRAGLRENEQAIGQLGGVITEQLTNVRWELAQQHQTLAGILNVLRESRSNECRQLIEQGDANYRAGFLAEAKERYQLAAQQDNTNVLVWQQLGIIAVQEGAFAEAETCFKKAVAFARPEYPKLRAIGRTHLARLYYARERWNDAAEMLRAALADEPESAKNRYDLALVLAQVGAVPNALDAVEQAIMLDGSFYGYALADDEFALIRRALQARLLDELPARVALRARDASDRLAQFLEHAQGIEREFGLTLLDAELTRWSTEARTPLPRETSALLARMARDTMRLPAARARVAAKARPERDRAGDSGSTHRGPCTAASGNMPGYAERLAEADKKWTAAARAKERDKVYADARAWSEALCRREQEEWVAKERRKKEALNELLKVAT
jgi:Flp pilus assembly protein TadD